ncbi:MAG: type 1 glutamine amidotransferase [Alphaproteobacteria bacterium]
MRILIVQHHSNSGAGHLLEAAAPRGVEWSEVFPLERGDPIPETPNGYDGLIVFGGAPNAMEDDKYPSLKPTAALIRAFHAEAKPVLGICLGSQLVARAFGARVYKAERSEIGFYQLRLGPEADRDALLGDGVPDPIHLIEFHYDTFDLPEGATLLMSGADYAPVQSFRMGETTYAFQPHFEATPDQLRDWLKSAHRWVESEHPHVPGRIEDDLARHGQAAYDFAMRVGGRWFDTVKARRAAR